MLLINIEDVEPGMKVGALVIHPGAPDLALLKPGAELQPVILARLRRLGISQLWVEHDLTADLDAAVAPGLTLVKLEVYRHLKQDLARMARQTISNAQIHTYRQAVIGLVSELVATRDFAGLTDQLFASEGGQFTHSTNVAYLSVLVGLELKTYILEERSKHSGRRVDNMVSLGLAGMLHDIGKMGLSGKASEHHEVLGVIEAQDLEEYKRHPLIAYRMLQKIEIPATAGQAVLNHHQRFSGSGWPDMAEVTAGRLRGPLAGHKIHIFTRIVSAANVLDNLLRDAEGTQRPPVAALHDFASPRFNGWFDPIVRLVVLRRIPPFAVGSQVHLSNGRPAVVTSPNTRQPCRPTVRLLDESTQTAEHKHATLDLEAHPELHITHYAGSEVEKWLFELPEGAASPRAVGY